MKHQAAGQQLPFFTLVTTDGREVRYRDLWQQQNLVLVTLLRDSDEARAYAEELRKHQPELSAYDTEVVVWFIAHNPDARAALGEDFPVPSVLLADRFGEVEHVSRGGSERDLPRAASIVEWLRFIQSRCPECDPK
jgi:peroxiredoxin